MLKAMQTARERGGAPSEAPSLEAALRAGQERLRQAGVEAARRDARLLLAAALGWRPEDPLTAGDRPLAPAELRRYDALIDRRSGREPVSRILGRREFWSLDLAITPATLDPRPDSETLVEALLARVADRDRPWRVLDLGTGSGNLLLAVLSALPNAWGVGLDREAAGLAVAAGNAGTLGLAGRSAFAAGDWAAAMTGSWDLILCNPPYVRTADIDGLAPEVARFEPRCALDGGADGLAAYRRVVPEIARLLARDGLAAVELGAGQAAEVADLVGDLAGDLALETLHCVTDLAGIERCLLLGRRRARQKGSQD